MSSHPGPGRFYPVRWEQGLSYAGDVQELIVMGKQLAPDDAYLSCESVPPLNRKPRADRSAEQTTMSDVREPRTLRNG